MSVQKSLKSFFKPVQTKRVSSDSSESEGNAKKPKLETCKEDEKCASPKAETKQTGESQKSNPLIKTPQTQKVAPDSPELKDSDKVVSEDQSVTGEGDIAKESAITDKTTSTQETKDATVEEKELSYSQRPTQEARDDNTIPSKPDDGLKASEGEVLKDVTKEDGNKSNFTTPVKSESKFISTPLGMLSPLQCLARIKSQCVKTPALHHSIGPSWFFALQGEFSKPYFTKLSQFLVGERKKAVVYPPVNQVWTWTQLCTIKDVKVVILGQDPYHNPGQAHGLCFSVQKGIPPPPSLINMYKELESDIPGFKAPGHGYLIGWAQQGVLLLNACLTVRANAPNSHKDQGWEQLTDAVIKRLSDTGSGIVFLLWGSYASKKGSMVNKKKHHILQAPHPSPLSAHRGFMGCKHFSKCNALLKQSGRKPIDWAHLPLV